MVEGNPYPFRRQSSQACVADWLRGLGALALAAISCGLYGYPLTDGARVALAAVRDGLATAQSIEWAIFVLSSGESVSAFKAALEAAKL